MTEQWRPIPGYEGHYEASNLGRIRSVDRVILRAGTSGQIARGRVLRPRPRGDDRLNVSLHLNGVTKELRVHRLVLEAFVGPRPEGMEACHGDGDHRNNRLDNLRWDTHSSNMQDQLRHGTHWQAKRTHCVNGHPLVQGRGQRLCRTCRSERALRSYHAKRAKASAA